MTKRALIVVDVQHDFLPGGALAVPHGDEVIAPINALMPCFDVVVFTQDWHPRNHVSFASNWEERQAFETVSVEYGTQVLWPDHCVAGTHGADLSAELDATRATAVIRKGTNPKVDSYSGFREADGRSTTGLAGLLRELDVTDVAVCGLATDYCVAWTAMDAARAGFATRIVTDACRAIDVNGSLALAREQWRALGVDESQATDILATNGKGFEPKN